MEKIINKDVVNKVINNVPSDNDLFDLADVFKVFGDSTRIKIIAILLENELCVYDIAYCLGMNQSAISHQLRILKTNKLVKTRRDGKMVYYSLDDEHVKSIYKAGFEHIMEDHK
ncbi:MAG: metalloregulator ArsR/SmtB family transcription factor [Thomasclavelia sp.]|jgi:DNA-binding transcriptional ArsR family regulator|nr:metalloregulator ArsR/SmtB family transcription factor [Thomasclavelia sp.]